MTSPLIGLSVMISNEHFQRGKEYLRSVSMTTVGLKQLFKAPFYYDTVLLLYSPR